MKLKRGITLIVLVLTIILALILITATTLAVGNSIDNARLAAFANDLKEVQDAVKVYYMENDSFPTPADSTDALSQKDIFDIVSNKVIFKQDLSVNNDYNENENLGAFYKIDLKILGVEQTIRGTMEDRKADDIYVVSYPSMKIYYLAGVKAKNNTYYSLSTRLTDVVKIVDEPAKYTDNEIYSAYGITVKKLKKAWTNSLNLNIEAQMESNEGLYIKVQDGTEKKIDTVTGQNIFILNEFDKIYSQNENKYLATNISTADIDKFNSAVQDNKSMEILKINEDNMEIIGTIKVNLSNYETTLPIKATDSVVEKGDEYNTVTFKVYDDVSGIREVRYEYLQKFDEATGSIVPYYDGVTTFDPSYIKTRGKKAELYEDGTVKIKIPKDIEGIEIRIFDRAGNVSEKILQSNFMGIWVGIEKVYINVSNSTGLIGFNNAKFRINIRSNTDIVEAKVSVSSDNNDWIEKQLSNVSGQTVVSTEIEFFDLKITDAVYVKVFVRNANGDTETRVKKFNINNSDTSDTDETIKEVELDKPVEFDINSSSDIQVTLAGREIIEGEFSFELVEDTGEIVSIGNNEKDGNISLNSIKYTKSGIYNYKLMQVNMQNDNGVTYDRNFYDITVKVYENGNIKCENPSIVFKNSYKAERGTVIFSGSVVIINDSDGSGFGFRLTKVGEEDYLEVKSDSNSTFKFPVITFTEPGVYKYTISQVIEDNPSYKYDTKIVNITVNVEDNYSGRLVVDVEYDQPLVFTNEYDSSLDIPDQPKP